MKRLFTSFLAFLILAFGYSEANATQQSTDSSNADDFRQALYGAIENSRDSLKQAPFGNKTIAILPFAQDSNGIIAGKMKNLLTQCGFSCVEGKEDPMWNEIIKEIAWDERKDDIIDSATLVRFGKLKAAQILVYGKVNVLSKNNSRIYAEIELHATNIATKQHIWGGSFGYRFYPGNDIQGIINLDNDIKSLLKSNFKAAQTELNEPQLQSKLSGIKTVAMIPLAGDIDQYMTGLAIEVLTQTRLIPRNPQIPSLSQTRQFIRDGQFGSDAMLYGAIRDLSKKLKTTQVEGKNRKIFYTLNADIQLFLEDAKTGNILWSKTINCSQDVTEEQELTNAEQKAEREERRQIRKEKMEELPEILQEDIVDNWKTYLFWIGGIVGVIILLVIIIAIVKGILSNFFVR